jgi:hypothetical protein
MEWTLEVAAHMAAAAAAVAHHIVVELGTPPFHVVDAMLVSIECHVESGYAVHANLPDINFPLVLAPGGRVSLPLFLFRVLMRGDVRTNYAWLGHVADNMRVAITHRAFTPAETALQIVHGWFCDVAGSATVITWVASAGRPDLQRVVAHASYVLHLVYGSRDKVQHALGTAAKTTWPLEGAFLAHVQRVVRDAQIPMQAVEWPGKAPDFVVECGAEGAGLICAPRDKILLLLLLLFAAEVDLVANDANAPPCVLAIVRAVRAARDSGVRGEVQYELALAGT